jgi:hypothetical protein
MHSPNPYAGPMSIINNNQLKIMEINIIAGRSALEPKWGIPCRMWLIPQKMSIGTGIAAMTQAW